MAMASPASFPLAGDRTFGNAEQYGERRPWGDVVSDDAISVPAEKQHLRFPGIARQRPTMGEEDRLPLTPFS